jgi:hypothetical protein
MNMVTAQITSRSKGVLCFVLLFGCLFVTGCGTDRPGVGASGSAGSVSSVAGSGASTSLLFVASDRTSVAPAAVSGSRSALARERSASLAAARRAAAAAISPKHEATARLAGHHAYAGPSKAIVRAAVRKAEAGQRSAVKRAGKISVAAVKADPSSCLKRTGALAATKAETKAQALRVRAVILRCLHSSEIAEQQAASVTSPMGGSR